MADYTGSFSGSFEGIFLGGVISSSNQLSIDWNSNVIANKPTTISPFQANSIISNNRFRETTYPAISASVSTRVTTLEVDVDTLSTQIAAAASGTVPPGTISGSQQIADLGYLTSASAAALGFGSGGGQTYTAGLGITIASNVISLDTSSTHFIQGVSASAAASGFGSGGGSNAAPTIADQSMAAVPESSSGGYSVGLITATDAEGNTITFASFTVSNVYLSTNSSVNLTSSLGGTSLYDPSVDPFQANSSGQITLKNGQFLNADVADRYVYLATVTDPFATTSGSGFVTIPISQDASSSIGANGGNYYIIESAVTADNLTTNTDGRTAGDVTFTSGVSQMRLVKSNTVGYVRFSNGTTQYTGSAITAALELAQNISGSGLTFDLGSTIGIEITASEVGFETTKQYRNHTLNIAKNFAPSGSMVRTDANLNTNGARSGNTIATLTWTDSESNSLHNPSFTLSSNAGLSSSFTSSYTYNIFPTGSLSAGTYYVSASVKDQHGFRFGSSSMSFTVVQAGAGTLVATGGFYVLESATGSEKIVTNTNGRPSGTQVDLNVSYSPQYNSAAVQSFT
jgi:hypothetical protein